MNSLEKRIQLQRKVFEIRTLQLKLSLRQHLKQHAFYSFAGGFMAHRFTRYAPRSMVRLARARLLRSLLPGRGQPLSH